MNHFCFTRASSPSRNLSTMNLAPDYLTTQNEGLLPSWDGMFAIIFDPPLREGHLAKIMLSNGTSMEDVDRHSMSAPPTYDCSLCQVCPIMVIVASLHVLGCDPGKVVYCQSLVAL